MKIYIIPAYKETIRNRGYSRIISGAKEKGYEVEILNLQIQNKSLHSLAIKAINKIEKNSVIFGFSMGALIGYYISTMIPINKGIFCSLSPCLDSDLKKIRGHKKIFGTKVDELYKTKYKKSLAKKTVFICGKKEMKLLVKRTKKLASMNKGKLIMTESNHELDNDTIAEILKNLSFLNHTNSLSNMDLSKKVL